MFCNLIYKHCGKIILQQFDRKKIERHFYPIGHYCTLYQTL